MGIKKYTGTQFFLRENKGETDIKMWRKAVGIKKIIIAGILIVVPYAACNWFVFVFLVPVLCWFYAEEKASNSFLVLFSMGLAALVLLPLVTYDAGVYLISVFAVTVFLSGFFVISKLLIRRFRENFFSIFIPCIVWSLLLYCLNIKSLMAAAFDIGILFPASAPVIGYTGSIGLTVLIVLFNSAAARSIVKKDKLSIGAGVVLFFLFVSLFIFSTTRDPAQLHIQNSRRTISLIQGDVPRSSMHGYEEKVSDRINKYIGLSEKAAGSGASLIVWPEYTLPIDIMNRFPRKMEPIITEIKKTGVNFVIGSMISDQGGEKHKYNTALVFGGDGEIEDIYYSQSPSIFTRNIHPGSNDKKTYLDKAGITLCWEEICSEIFRDYVKDGAEYFICLSSNADLDYSWFKRYVSFYSRARASENMRYLARATQTGVTQIIDPFGRVAGKIPTGRSAFLSGEIYHVNKVTFYAAYGDILTKVIIFLLVLAGIIIEVILRKQRVTRNELSR